MKMPIGQLETRAPFKDLFPIDEEVLAALTASIKADGFDPARTIFAWKAPDGARVVVEGHMRLLAAKAARLSEVHVTTRKFADEDEAFQFAIAAQRDRRNLTKEQIATAIARAELARAESTDLAGIARSVKSRDASGQLQGTTKDPVKQAVVDKAAKAGVGKRTAEKGLANARAERKPRKAAAPPTPVTIAELKELHKAGLEAARDVGPRLTTLAKASSYDNAMDAGRAAAAATHTYNELLKKLTKYIDQQEEAK